MTVVVVSVSKIQQVEIRRERAGPVSHALHTDRAAGLRQRPFFICSVYTFFSNSLRFLRHFRDHASVASELCFVSDTVHRRSGALVVGLAGLATSQASLCNFIDVALKWGHFLSFLFVRFASCHVAGSRTRG